MKRIAIFVSAVLACVVARAYDSYTQLINDAVSRSPEIAAGKAAAQAATAEGRAENALEGPELEFEHLWAASSPDKKWNIGVTQEFAYPGLYSARSRAIADKAAQARLQLDEAIYDKGLEVKELILEIIQAHARLDLYNGIGENMKRIAALTQKSFDGGNATILDLRKMQVAMLDNDRTLADIRADIATLQSRLAGLGVQPPVEASFWQSYPVQACARPDSDADMMQRSIAEASRRAIESQSRAVRLEAWPTLAVGYRHAFEEAQHFNGFSIGLRLPSFSQSKRRKAAALEAERLHDENHGRLETVNAELEGLYKAATELSSTLQSYRDLTGDDTYLQLLGKAYDGGELTIIDYLNEINLYSQSRLNFIDLEYRYNLTLARLNRYRAVAFN